MEPGAAQEGATPLCSRLILALFVAAGGCSTARWFTVTTTPASSDAPVQIIMSQVKPKKQNALVIN